jgi:hypothetical protein
MCMAFFNKLHTRIYERHSPKWSAGEKNGGDISQKWVTIIFPQRAYHFWCFTSFLAWQNDMLYNINVREYKSLLVNHNYSVK